ncbi:MAG: hypothetical protein ACD_76C00116G0001 [uncultured bacterium]|nr:MAG: hypothetical protein ACD_76C00116G0001 [uncultured bacterium]
MYTIYTAKQEAIEAIKSGLRKAYTPSIDEIVFPPDKKIGDLSFPCFTVAKGMGRNPAEIASEIAARVAPKGLIKELKAVGPYVNFVLDQERLSESVLGQIASERNKYGFSDSGNGKRIMVEYASLNTHKISHVGHLRNILIGESYIHILRANGYEVTAAAYIGDIGAHVAKCLYGVLNLHAGEEPEKGKEDIFLQNCYVEAVKNIEDNPEKEKEVKELQRKLESGDKELVKVWKKTRAWSLSELKRLYKLLGASVDVWYFESKVEKTGKKLVRDMLKRGIAEHSQGAVIVNLEAEGLGPFLILRSDGGALYSTKDLALAFKKQEAYHPDKSVYIVDSRQSLFLKQLFATLKRLGLSTELRHLSYEFLTLKDGTMSSRTGNVVTLMSFWDQVYNLALTETQKRHPNWKSKKLEKIAKGIALAAMKFSVLKIDPQKTIVFDPKESLSFDGFTGPYVLYSLTRARAILRKAKIKPVNHASSLTAPEEKRLAFEMARFPEVVSEIARTEHVSRLPEYLFGLSKLFAEFYDRVSVLSASDEATISARLALVESAAQVIENGLGLMGIASVDEM